MAQYFLGIDVSKGYADFRCLDQQQAPAGTGFQLDDTHTGHEKLTSYLRELVRSQAATMITAAVESTGGYENNWYRCLRELAEGLPVRIARVNPARVKAHWQASGRRNRTDQTSAQDVAEYVASHHEQLLYNEAELDSQLRQLWTQIQLLVKQKTQLLNHLEATLYTTMPELLSYCLHGMPLWLLRVLSDYPSYQDLARADLTQIPYVSNAKAAQLKKRLEASTIGASNAISSSIVRSLARQVLSLDTEITAAKKQLENHCADVHGQVRLLRSFKSIGAYTAVGLLVYIGDVHRFSSAKKLASYFGLHPVCKQSGDGIWGIHMSKQGASQVRALLYMVTLGAIQRNQVIHALYARCRACGMRADVAIGLCMHKILRIVYGILIHNQPFDPEKHRTARTAAVALQNRSNVERRDYDPHAPISSRQHKKRKAQSQQLSHDDAKVVTSGITPPAPSPTPVDATVRKKHKRNHQKKQK